MARAADSFDGILAHTALRDMAPWVIELLEQRDELPGPAFDAAVVAALRTHVCPDYEDPARDPDLGEPIG